MELPSSLRGLLFQMVGGHRWLDSNVKSYTSPKESLSGVYIVFLLPFNKSIYQTCGSHWVSLSSLPASLGVAAPLWHDEPQATLLRGIVPSEQLCTQCARALSAALFVTRSWQSPIRACTRKRRGANEIFAVLLLILGISDAEPSNLKHVFLVLTVYILTFVSMSVHIYCSY